MLKQNKLNWAQETVFIRDEAGRVLAEFDRDMVAGGVQWSFRRYNYYLFGKMVSAEGLLDDNDNNGIYEWGKRYYFHDHLGSIRGIIDGQGNYLQAIEYWPYGEELTSATYNEDSYRYTGHERDYDISMDYMRARHYKYMIGRFQTPDPVNGSISSPQSWNLYSYVQNNPMMFTDPWGLWKKGEGYGIPQNVLEAKITKEECESQGCKHKEGKCYCPDENGNWVQVNSVDEAKRIRKKREEVIKMEIMRAVTKLKEAGINISFADIKNLLNKFNYIDFSISGGLGIGASISLICDKNCYLQLGIGLTTPGISASITASPYSIPSTPTPLMAVQIISNLFSFQFGAVFPQKGANSLFWEAGIGFSATRSGASLMPYVILFKLF